jgi:hypothetical protein
MKYLTLLLLVGCIGFDEKVLHPTKAQLCAAEIRQYERLLTYPPSESYNWGICEMEPTLEMCSCSDISPLPLNCFETGIKIDERIEKQEKTLKEWRYIIQGAKEQTKNDKKTIQLLNNMYNDDKQELEQLKKNRFEYTKRCKENK